MDAKTEGEHSTEPIRERVESKRDEFAGGPEPGWQAMEAAAAEARQSSTPAGDAMGMSPEQTGSSPATGGTATAVQAPSGTTEGEDYTPPFNDEHPLGIGQQCFKCGAYNEVESQTCWNCSSELPRSAVETPGIVESVLPTEDDEALPRISTGGTTGTDTSGGAHSVTSD
jgi:hypothetical protein